MADRGTRSGAHGERRPAARKEAALWVRAGTRGPSCFSERPHPSPPADPIAEAFLPRESCPVTVRLATETDFTIPEIS